MADVSRLNVQIDGDESGLVAAANRSEAALNDLGNAASRSGGRITAAGQQAKAFGGQARLAGGHTANLAAQFNDIGLMLASGQSPLMLAMQQGTQVNQVLAQMGTNGVSRVQALQTAFLSVISPANLVTFAVIAGGAALAQYGISALGATRETRNLEDTLEDLQEAASAMSRAADILSRSVDDLREEYGDLTDQVIELARAQLQLGQAEAAVLLRRQAREVRDLADAYGVLNDETGRNLAIGALVDQTEALRQLRQDFDLTGEAAQTVSDAFSELLNAQTIDEQANAFGRVAEAMTGAGVELAEWPEDLREAYRTSLQFREVLIEIETSANRAGEALKASFEPFTQALGDPKAGGGLDQYQARLEALQEALMTEEEAEMASYQRRQELLEYALEKQLLTQQQYQDMMRQVSEQHADSMERIEAKQHDAIAAQARGSFNELANALRQHNDDLFRIAKIAGAAEALINAWRAYAQTLADPSLPFFAKFAAAASVLAAGLNAVSAIKGASGSGGGAHGGYSGGGRNAGGANNLQVGGEVSRNVTVALEGEIFTRDMVKTFINKINEAVEDGAQIRVV